MVKFVQNAKETFNSLKDSQRAYVFQAVWFGKLIPGIPAREQFRVKGLMDKVKQRVGKFPGVAYEHIYLLIEDYKLGRVNKETLVDELFVFYPIQSTLTLKVCKEDCEFNKQMRAKILCLNNEVLEEVLIDLHNSEYRDKSKVLATI